MWVFSMEFASCHFPRAQNFEVVSMFLENVRISGLQPVRTSSSLWPRMINRSRLDVVCFLRKRCRVARRRLAIHAEMHTNLNVMSVMFVQV